MTHPGGFCFSIYCEMSVDCCPTTNGLVALIKWPDGEIGRSSFNRSIYHRTTVNGQLTTKQTRSVIVTSWPITPTHTPEPASTPNCPLSNVGRISIPATK